MVDYSTRLCTLWKERLPQDITGWKSCYFHHFKDVEASTDLAVWLPGACKDYRSSPGGSIRDFLQTFILIVGIFSNILSLLMIGSLLTIGEVHTMHPDCIRFPAFPGLGKCEPLVGFCLFAVLPFSPVVLSVLLTPISETLISLGFQRRWQMFFKRHH